MYREIIEYAEKRWRKQLTGEFTEYWNSLRVLAKKQFRIGLIGLQSSGKTTLLNALLEYPLLPSLITKGTVCPLEIESGPEPELCVTYEGDGQGENSVIISGKLPQDVFGHIIEYICRCNNQFLFFPENAGYFLKDEKRKNVLSPDDFILNAEDPRHGLLLALIVLNAHITKGDAESDRELLSDLAKERLSLLGLLGIGTDRIVGLKLKWNSELLPPGTVLIDLPGLGGDKVDVAESDAIRGIVVRSANTCDMLMCILTGEVMSGPIDDVFSELGMNDPTQKFPETIMIINKADLLIEYAASRSAAKRIVPQAPPPVYVISAAAAEYLYLKSGIGVENTLYWRDSFLPMLRRVTDDDSASDENRMNAVQDLEKSWTTTYECDTDEGIVEVSLAGFLQTELKKTLLRRQNRFFKRVFFGNTEASEQLMRLIAAERAFFNKVKSFPTALTASWISEADKAAVALLSELDSFRYIKSAFFDKHSMEKGILVEEWKNRIEAINKECTKLLLAECEKLFAHNDRAFCTTIQPGAKVKAGSNDSVIQELYSIAVRLISSDGAGSRTYCGTRIHYYKLIESFEKLVAQIKRSLAEYEDCIKQLPLRCRERCKFIGYDNFQFNRFFMAVLLKLSEKLLAEYSEIGFSFEFAANASPIKGFEAAARKVIESALLSSLLTDNFGQGRCILSKSKLIEALKRPLIDESTAVKVLPFESEERLWELLNSAQMRCDEWREKLLAAGLRLPAEYAEKAAELSSAADAVIAEDTALLEHLYSSIAFEDK